MSAHKAKCVACGNEYTDYDASPRQWCSVGCQYGDDMSEFENELDAAPDGSWKYQAAYDRGRQDERKAIVAWLRKIKHVGSNASPTSYDHLTIAIEAGMHLK